MGNTVHQLKMVNDRLQQKYVSLHFTALWVAWLMVKVENEFKI